MFFCCGEDASAVLPEIKDSKRYRVFLFGYLCWEGVSSSKGVRGVYMLDCGVSDLCRLLPAMTISDMMQYHLQMVEHQRLQIMRMSEERTHD
ncbi:unnamed protein product [Phytomonas sp. Hart1]|nr:unnamed protein product [Phytomonas sp. Hart1]|eukprot:CCW67680.1 unnamed protein product [Phytomonas sp. isolate Hart1]